MVAKPELDNFKIRFVKSPWLGIATSKSFPWEGVPEVNLFTSGAEGVNVRNKIIPYNSKLKSTARLLRKNMTHGELILWEYLRGKKIQGLKFSRQIRIDNYIVDFYCKQLRLVIEVDGSSHDSDLRKLKDKIRQKKLESLGVKFLRFSDDDVKTNMDWVIQEIYIWLENN